MEGRKGREGLIATFEKTIQLVWGGKVDPKTRYLLDPDEVLTAFISGTGEWCWRENVHSLNNRA